MSQAPLYHVKLTGGRSKGRQWSLFVENGYGGGFGTNAGAGASRASALRLALAHLPVGTEYHLSVNGKYLGLFVVTRDE
jgi:hypothetical protein